MCPKRGDPSLRWSVSLNIAIIGSGISGLTAAYYLSKAHKVDLFEKNSRAGGHANTIELEDGTPVDSGFIVLNDRNYPGLTSLLGSLNIELHPTEMSFSLTGLPFSWCSDDFYRLRFIRSYKKLKLFKEIVRFNRLAKLGLENLSAADWLDKNRFSELFRDAYLFPMCSAIWSSRGQTIEQFPVRALTQFLNNHGLLNLFNRPRWFSLKGGSRAYVSQVLKTIGIDNLHLNEEVKIIREEGQVVVATQDDARHYDLVIFACHANETLEVLQDLTKAESDALSKFNYSANPTVMHFDHELMPGDTQDWASWNAVKQGGYDYVTYWMNNLQDLNTKRQVFVSIGDFPNIEPDKVVDVIDYEHPIFTQSTLEGQDDLQDLQGSNNTYHTGAHLGFGFHEDGLQSALRVVKWING